MKGLRVKKRKGKGFEFKGGRGGKRREAGRGRRVELFCLGQVNQFVQHIMKVLHLGIYHKQRVLVK